MTTHRDSLRINPLDRDALRRAGLDSADALLKCLGDRIVAWSRSTDTVRVDLPESAGGGSLYVKRYHHLRWKPRIKAMLRGAFFGRSRARAEYDRLLALEARGAPVVHAVACGERRVLHFVRSSFLVTRAVPDAVSLTAFLHPPSGTKPPAAFLRRLAESLGRQIAALHRTGVIHGALFWRNILVRRDREGGFAFTLLDPPAARFLTAWRYTTADDLADLAAAALECGMRTEMMRFFLAYLGTRRLDSSQKALARDVLRRAEPLRPHEAYRLKMHRVFQYHLVAAPASTPR